MKITFKKSVYLLYYEDDDYEFVAIDEASGGYPYPVSIFGAKPFTKESAEDYVKSFKYLKIMEVKSIILE
jgi:hypothetical protein